MREADDTRGTATVAGEAAVGRAGPGAGAAMAFSGEPAVMISRAEAKVLDEARHSRGAFGRRGIYLALAPALNDCGAHVIRFGQVAALLSILALGF